MQCAAVLLLELGYQSRHIQDNNAQITTDIQKLINWLHAMQRNDPVAERAYHVMRRILQNVAPALQPKAAELLTEGLASEAADEQSFMPFVTPHKDQHYDVNWAQGDFFDGSASVTGHQYYSQGTNHNRQDTTQPSQDHWMYGSYPPDDLQMSSAFGNPFINYWDEGVPLIGTQNLWYNQGFPSANMPEDLSDMDLFPTPYMEQQHHHHHHQHYQQHQPQQPFGSAEPSTQHEQRQRRG